jgi:broad specificity phosphatase PhoE
MIVQTLLQTHVHRSIPHLTPQGRPGGSNAEADGYLLTNPVSKTSLLSGLSPAGRAQVVRSTLPRVKELGACEGSCWIWPSITQRCYETAEILGYALGVGRNRIVPEYSFLDPRGAGVFERAPLDIAERELARGDRADFRWRPPPNTDGTEPNSVEDVLVRLRQMLSILETQYGPGENILIVAPDSDNLSILQSAVLGRDLRDHRTLAFAPGEVRRLELAAELPVEPPPSSLACPRPPQCL